MVEQGTADVRNVGWSLRQKEILGFVLDAIQSLRSRARAFLEIFELLVNFQIVFSARYCSEYIVSRAFQFSGPPH